MLSSPATVWWCRRLIVLLVSAWVFMLGFRSVGQAQVTLDGSLGPSGPLPGPDVVVPAEVGQMRGGNLFHSFGQFNVPESGRVTFTGPEVIDHILGRITGGEPSFIDGSLRSEIAGANLYLINPAGVVFGPHARLDVQGSAHISTADLLRFTDHTRFSASLGEASDLTVAPPSAFGFIHAQPAPITIDGSQLTVPEGAALSLVGGDITIQGDSTRISLAPNLETQGGPMAIVSLASPGDVVVNTADTRRYVDTDHVAQLGTIVVSDKARLRATGQRGGMIVMRGEHVRVENATIEVQTAREVNGTAVGIDIDATGDVIVSNGANISTSPSIDGHTGAIRITAGGDVAVSNQGEQGVPSSISSLAVGGFNAGDIAVTAGRSVTITGQRNRHFRSSISSHARTGGQAGDITLAAPILHIDGGILSSGIIGDLVAGRAGDIVVQAERVALVGGGRIDSGHIGGRQGGMITITAQEAITIAGQSPEGQPSGILSQAFGAGDAGQIMLSTSDLTIVGAGVSTGTFGSGRAGDITIQAESVALADGGLINSGTAGDGQGGSVAITAQEAITIAGSSPEGIPSGILSAAVGEGAAGQITLAAPMLLVEDGLIAVTTLSRGRAGDMIVAVDNLILRQGGRIDSSTQGGGAGGTATVRGMGGEAAIAEAVAISGQGSGIFTNATGDGMGGNMTIQARHVHLSGGATIAAESTGRGHAGTIRVTQGNTLLLSGHSAITTQAMQAAGGGITIETEVVSLTDSDITAEARGASQMGSDGGNIIIQTHQMVLNRSAVKANAFGGDGGQIHIIASEAFLADAQTCASFECLTASSELGISGIVDLQSPVTNLGEAVTPLSQSFAQDTAVLRDRCAARLRAGNVSSLIDSSRDRVTTPPDGLLPRRLYRTTRGAMARANTDAPIRTSTPAGSGSLRVLSHMPVARLRAAECNESTR